jgi:DNA-binding transcriptional LysR family regulator
MQLSDRIGRRMKLRDLHVFMSVVQMGSMGKAASLLNTTQSAISRSIADLELAIGIRLLDRSRQGVEPTDYGRALLDGGAAVFDELRQAVKNIEFLSDPAVGHIRVSGNESTSAGWLPATFARLHHRRPGLSMQVTPSLSISEQYRALRERKVDLIVGHIPPSVDKDIETEVLLRDPVFVVAGLKNRWARRRKVELNQLADEPWVLPRPETLVASLFAEVFRARGMEFPPRGSATGSIHMACALLAGGPFLAIFPRSVLQLAKHFPPLKVLPIRLPIPPTPTGIMTLKNRTHSPVAKLFIECAREVTKPLARQAL